MDTPNMKIKRVRIENFRSWKDQTIDLDNYNCFVGANGAGKSAILCALNIFFRHSQNSPTNILNLHEEDFYQKDTGTPIRITVTFDDLNEEAQIDFKSYYRQGELTVHVEAVWDEQSQSASGRHYGSRRVMRAFKPYFKAETEGKSAAELKTVYRQIREGFPELPEVAFKEPMREALRTYEEAHPDVCELEPSENQFYGWTKGTNYLEKYVQWVYVPAVKDAASEQDESKASAFGQLLERTIRREIDFEPRLEEIKQSAGAKYRELLDQNRSALTGISERISERLRMWSSPRSEVKLDWIFNDRTVSVQPPSAHAQAGEDSFLGEVSRLGNGLQRSYLVALLQELADQKGAENQPTLILGFEEPELYQHPPQIKHLRFVLEELAKKGSQVLITTHSPHLVASQGFVTVRRITKKRGDKPESCAARATTEGISQALATALGEEPPKRCKVLPDIEQIMEPSLSELYFCDVAILVEGPEDVAYLTTHLALTEQLDWFRRYGCHFVVCRGKTNISRPLAIANELRIPTFTIFDSDCSIGSTSDPRDIRDNKCLLSLTRNSGENSGAEESVVGSNFAIFAPNITHAVKAEYGLQDWQTLDREVRSAFDLREGVKGKNAYLIAHCLEAAYEKKGPSAILASVTSALRSFAESGRS